MRGAWAGLALAVIVGCGDSSSEFVEGRGLPVAKPDKWQPQRPDPSEATQLRHYVRTRIAIGRARVDIVVADTPEKRGAALGHLNAEALEGASMLIQLPDGQSGLDLSTLTAEVDVLLGNRERVVTDVNPPRADRAGTKYVFLLPKGSAERLQLAPGQPIEMGGGIANAL